MRGRRHRAGWSAEARGRRLSPMAVTEKDRAHFRAIAEGMERLNRQSLEREQELTPGERILSALRLTDRFLRSSPMEEKPPPVSLALLWRQRSANGRGR